MAVASKAKSNSKNSKRVSLTTGTGTFCFPRVFKTTAGTKDDGSPSYDIQFLIPKTDRESVRAILKAIKEVGEDSWGERWKQVRTPLRDGDREKDELTEDGSTKGEKYPERLGHYMLNARSSRPVAVVDRNRVPIVNESDLYAGCKGRMSLTFYAYTQAGNIGIAAGLNGVQKVGDGEPLGGASVVSVESMFDLLEDEDDADPWEDDEAEDAPAKAAAKPAATKRRAKPEPEPEPEEDDDLDDDDDDEPEPAPARRKPAAAKAAPAKAAAKAAPAAKRKPAPEPEPEDDEEDLYDDLDDLDDDE
jgi:chemotaxis protein histidine kinase CheA